METILLANGTLIEDAHCMETNGRLFVYISNQTDLRRFFDLFMEPRNTRIIEADRYGDKTTYEGYTYLYSLSREYGNINIVMKRGDADV